MSKAIDDHPFIAFWRSTKIFDVRIPKEIVIGNMQWGLALRTMQVAVGAALLLQMILNEEYQQQFPASGVMLESYMDRSNLVPAMQTAMQQPYCASPYSMDYSYCDATKATGSSNEFWCERNITCEFADPAVAMGKQTPQDIWVYTYFKRRATRRVECSAGASACNTASGELLEMLGPRCQCIKTENAFVAGADAGSFTFLHKPQLDQNTAFEFTTVDSDIVAQIVDPATGVPVSSDFQLVRTIAAGSPVSLTVSELLQMTGLGTLDDVDPVVVATYPDTTGTASYRITGIAFDVRVVYFGSISRFRYGNPPRAQIRVSVTPGWHNTGDDVHFDDEHYLGLGSGEVEREQPRTGDTYSVYKRGVHIKISFGGSIGWIVPMFLITQIAATLFYIGICATIIHFFILRVMRYASRVYRESVGEVITVEGVHDKKGVQAIIAAVAFNHLQSKANMRAEAAGTGGAFFRQALLDELSVAGVPDEMSKGIAQLVAPYGAVDVGKFIDCSAYQSQLTMTEVGERVNEVQAKSEGAIAVPELKPTP